MSEKPESDDFEDEEPAEPVTGSEDVDLDQVTKDLDLAKRRGQKLGDPEMKQTQELTSDVEDFDIGEQDGARKRKKLRLPE
jgi:hypothetical protein